MQGNAEVHFFEINYPIAEVTSVQNNSEAQNSAFLSSVFEPEASVGSRMCLAKKA